MQRLREYIELCERLLDHINHYGQIVDLYINPTPFEFSKFEEARFFLFPQSDLLFVWSAYQAIHSMLHGWMKQNKEILADIGGIGPFIGGVIAPDIPVSDVFFNDYGPGKETAILKSSKNFNRMLKGKWKVSKSYSTVPKIL